MARDYAKRTSPSKSPANPLRLLPLVLLLAIIVVGGLYYLKKHPLHLQATKHAMLHKTGNLKETAANQSNLPPMPKFDFYTMLPKMHVVPVNAIQKPAPAVSTTTTNDDEAASNSDESFALRVAAFKNYVDAQRLKAQLSLLGFNIFIQEYQSNNALWYRVNVGPYDSLSSAKIDQKHLLDNSIHSMVVAIDGNTSKA